MSDQDKKDHSIEDLIGNPEPWESWESKLVGACLLTAVVGLLVLGWLIHTFILR